MIREESLESKNDLLNRHPDSFFMKEPKELAIHEEDYENICKRIKLRKIIEKDIENRTQLILAKYDPTHKIALVRSKASSQMAD